MLEGEKAQQAGPLTTGVFDYKLYNNIYNSQTVVSWSLEGQVWEGQVYMSGLEAWSSLHASLGTGMAHDRYSWGHKSELSTHTGGWREEGSDFMWTLFTEQVFLSNTGRLK